MGKSINECTDTETFLRTKRVSSGYIPVYLRSAMSSEHSDEGRITARENPWR